MSRIKFFALKTTRQTTTPELADLCLFGATSLTEEAQRLGPGKSLESLGVRTVKHLTEILFNHTELAKERIANNLEAAAEKHNQKIENVRTKFISSKIFSKLVMNPETHEIDHEARDEYDEYEEVIDQVMEEVNTYLRIMELRIKDELKTEQQSSSKNTTRHQEKRAS